MATDTQRKKKARRPSGPLVEFTSAAHEHTEPAFEVSFVPGANAAPLGPFDVPAIGYMRSIALLVTCTGGVAGPGVLHEDSPFRVLSEVVLEDVNGAPIFGPLDGYETFLANLFGGNAFRQDPRLQPDYSAAVAAFSFILRIPVEIHPNTGLGSLANQNSAAAYRVRLTGNTAANVWSTAPTTVPTVRIRGILEAWTQPTATDLAGRPQAVMPPRHGTTQYWSKQSRGNIAAGDAMYPIARVGNLIRNLIFILRTPTGAAGVRSTANLPDPVRINWDQRQLHSAWRQYLRALLGEQYVLAADGLPAGVLAFNFDHDVVGHGGNGTPELWIPTVQSTRLEFGGVFGAGDLTVIVNDIAPVEVTQDERYAEVSDTGAIASAV